MTAEHGRAAGRTRIEHDAMGEVAVPADALWGAQTQRAVENFPVSGERVDPRLIVALARIKAAAARANAALGRLDPDDASAIAAAADAIAAGAHAEQFPVDVFQTGSGTSTNMNVNEVIAALVRAGHGRDVHPNDHVNASQSSNDVFPSAIHLAALEAVRVELFPALDELHGALAAKAGEFAAVVKAGRTHLMDATPVTLGQEFGGYAAQIAEGRERIGDTLVRVGRLPLGGTATGTGLNCPEGFAAAVIGSLAGDLELPLVEAPDHFAAQSARDCLVELSGQLRTLAVSLIKIANDLRWMASGPRTGLAELRLPDLQPGSSIMPGKVNPVIPEAVTQVGAQVIGNDAAIAFAGSQGNFELNVYLPVLARNLLQSISLLSNVSALFARRCVWGIEADVERCRTYAEATAQVATALNPHLGYETVAGLVKESARSGRPVRELVLERGLLAEADLDAALDLLPLTRGGLR
ncbi:MAG: class II fumarate hydratase [Acidimicrobiales bacterium]|nr:class II fumarate hydratase [Acidimicrobiales bacterium]